MSLPLLRTLRLTPSTVRTFSSTTRSLGVTVATLSPGDGKTFPRTGDHVKIHYTGTLLSTGKTFDSSVQRGTPFECQIGVGQVIKGWDEGVKQLSLGEKVTFGPTEKPASGADEAKLTCTPDYAYGSQSVGGGSIPANSTLVFEVELLGIKRE
ncbi:BZ3500_MvSof-1268-A1-R1_Chr3-1g06080 [Microbotryum saponariae]|uniref:peptidylprolyl isomerase n=1 Tax=Microbotryum saponariae TaxID=289078 RepID=A0A2X0KZ96_9BASI|nr:BZ3500_MvSof-1268-A1-R1_Chr3-1g06080 [Microbotryum saponariae]SDA03927.1 BZ3501_MvSof-1269-A2-R1_Chr3-2g05765 [Microbotryum saponariae]